jgi:uncharacterized protein YjiS (DUF1127 family)
MRSVATKKVAVAGTLSGTLARFTDPARHKDGVALITGWRRFTRGGRILNVLAHTQAAPEARLSLLRTEFVESDAQSGLLAILSLPATWWRRAHFRAQLRHLVGGEAGHLRDVGFDEYDARVEAARFFWQPVTMMRRF